MSRHTCIHAVAGSVLLWVATQSSTTLCASPPKLLVQRSAEDLWQNEKGVIVSACFSDDADILFGRADGSLWHFDIESGRGDEIKDAGFSPSKGVRLVADSRTGRVLSIDSRGRAVERAVPSLARTADPQLIPDYAGISWEGSHAFLGSQFRLAHSGNAPGYNLLVCDSRSGKTLFRVKTNGGVVMNVAFGPDGKSAYVAAGGNVECWSLHEPSKFEGEVDFRRRNYHATCLQMVRHNDADALCVAAHDSDHDIIEVSLRTIPEMKLLQEIRFAGGSAHALDVSRSGEDLIMSTSHIATNNLPSTAFVSLKQNAVTRLEYDRDWICSGTAMSFSGNRCVEFGVHGMRVWELHEVRPKGMPSD